MRFAVDVMLGKVARWLRVLGFDAIYFKKKPDAVLLGQCRREDRVLLSRSRKLAAEKSLRTHRVSGQTWRDQILEVLIQFQLAETVKPLTRCIECNDPLRTVSRASVEGEVPPHVFELHEAYYRCPSCHQVFWDGTHTEHIRAEIQSLLNEARAHPKD